ncbi:MAG: Spy/CpxP family protein refolding chaperone [Pseudomonadota bacterium]
MNDVVEKKSRKKIIALITGGAILVGSIAAWAGVRSHWHHGDHMGHAVDHISEELELNDGQRAQLETLGHTLMSFKKTLRSGDEVDIILASVQGSTLDQAALNSLIENKLLTAQAQAPQVINAVAEFYDGLDSSQQSEARDKLEHMAQWVKRHKHDHDE